ncbi:MAG: M56 family metallopeptidase [Elainella sp.]
MHLHLLLLALGLAGSVRFLLFRPSPDWSIRWQYALGLFLFPPLLLLFTAVSVLNMGSRGHMLGLPVGIIGYVCAFGFLGIAALTLVWRAVQGWRSLQRVKQAPKITLQTQIGYLLDTPIPFAAQIGFWQSQLVVSQGLLRLSPAQIEAVLSHEQAHAHYRDTFWFFWLGWLRQLTLWLPNTEQLWQELLLLREMRADQWATQTVEALLLAETLLHMAQSPLMDLDSACAAISETNALSRLEERIDALLVEPTPVSIPLALPWVWLLLSLIPLLTLGLHQQF